MFYFFNQFIAYYKILLIYNFLPIWKCVEETNYHKNNQEHSMFIATSIKAMLFYRPSGH